MFGSSSQHASHAASGAATKGRGGVGKAMTGVSGTAKGSVGGAAHLGGSAVKGGMAVGSGAARGGMAVAKKAAPSAALQRLKGGAAPNKGAGKGKPADKGKKGPAKGGKQAPGKGGKQHQVALLSAFPGLHLDQEDENFLQRVEEDMMVDDPHGSRPYDDFVRQVMQSERLKPWQKLRLIASFKGLNVVYAEYTKRHALREAERERVIVERRDAILYKNRMQNQYGKERKSSKDAAGYAQASDYGEHEQIAQDFHPDRPRRDFALTDFDVKLLEDQRKDMDPAYADHLAKSYAIKYEDPEFLKNAKRLFFLEGERRWRHQDEREYTEYEPGPGAEAELLDHAKKSIEKLKRIESIEEELPAHPVFDPNRDSWADQLQDRQFRAKFVAAFAYRGHYKEEISDCESVASVETISGRVKTMWDSGITHPRYLYARDRAVGFSADWRAEPWRDAEWDERLLRPIYDEEIMAAIEGHHVGHETDAQRKSADQRDGAGHRVKDGKSLSSLNVGAEDPENVGHDKPKSGGFFGLFGGGGAAQVEETEEEKSQRRQREEMQRKASEAREKAKEERKKLREEAKGKGRPETPGGRGHGGRSFCCTTSWRSLVEFSFERCSERGKLYTELCRHYIVTVVLSSCN